MNFLAAVAYYICLALPAAFTQPGDFLLAEPCNLVGCFDSFHGLLSPPSGTGSRAKGKRQTGHSADRREKTFLANCETPFGLLNDLNFFLKGKEWALLLMVMKKTV